MEASVPVPTCQGSIANSAAQLLLHSSPRDHDHHRCQSVYQTPCWAFSKFLCANCPVKKPSK